MKIWLVALLVAGTMATQIRLNIRVAPPAAAQMLAADLTLDGVQRMPAASVETAYATPETGASPAVAVADRSGLKFFVTGFLSGPNRTPVYELSANATWSAASSYNTANRMSLTNDWGVIRGTCDTRWDGANMVALGAYQYGWMFWDPAQTALVTTYHDPYLASAQTNHHVCVTELGTHPAYTTYGPFRFKSQTGTATYEYQQNGYFIWPDSDGGFLIGGTQNTNYSSGTPGGPSIFHVATLPTQSSTPGNAGADFSTDASYLNHADCGATSFVRSFQRPHTEADHDKPGGWCSTNSGGAATSWMEFDRFNGGIKIDNGQKRAFFAFLGLSGKTGSDPGTATDCTTGHTWYNNIGSGRDDNAAHGPCVAPYANTGPVATSRYLALCAYDLDDLEGNDADKTTLYDVAPVECVDVATQFGTFLLSIMKDGPGQIGCCAVDPINARTFYAISTSMVDNGVCPATNAGACTSVIWKWGWAAASRPIVTDITAPDAFLRMFGFIGDWKTTGKRSVLSFTLVPSVLPFAAGFCIFTLAGPFTRRRGNISS